MLCNFLFTGISPLLFHADDVEAADSLDAWRKDPANKNFSVNGDDRSPPWTWHTYLYKGPNGSLAWPAANVAVCLRQAGVQVIMKKQKTFKEKVMSGILFYDEHCRFSSEGKEISLADIASLHEESFSVQLQKVKELGFRLFVKRAAIGKNKHVRVRARFEKWEVSGQFDVTAKEITPDALGKILTIAGNIGLGDWRPGSPKAPGSFGRFTASVKKAT